MRVQTMSGDVIGVWVDVIHRKMHFSLNGKVQKKGNYISSNRKFVFDYSFICIVEFTLHLVRE